MPYQSSEEKKAYLKRYVKSNLDRIKEYRKNYYLKNKERIQKRCKKFYEENQEQVKAYREKNKETRNKRDRERRRLHPERFREARLREEYGITLGDFHKMSNQQGEVCLICGQKKPLCIDHDHKTGKVRGLICDSCNKGLGFFKDSQENLLEAGKYLNEFHNFGPC